jgi:5-methylcytosine-specific restriction enzyme A
MARLYDKAHWRYKRRKQQLRDNPLCVMCLEQGRIELAVVADHKEPHHGDKKLFWNGELQSLCLQHHNAHKQQQERKGFHNGFGVDGLPLDPNHPFIRQR